MENKQMAERRVVRFLAKQRRGPRPSVARIASLHVGLRSLGRPVTVKELLVNSDLTPLYEIRGRMRVPTSYQDVVRELCWLVDEDLASWEVVGPPVAEGSWIRPPGEHEIAFGRRNNEDEWVMNGVMLTNEMVPKPFRLNNLLFRRLDPRPHAGAAVAKLWDVLSGSHHQRLEDLDLGPARALYPTARDLFSGLLKLHQKGAVEIIPIGI